MMLPAVMSSRAGRQVKTLGRRLYSYREKHGLTQPQVASLIGISRSIVSRLENGIRPSIRNLYLIRTFLERGSHA